ncbi:hypothetical protein PN462_11460 [Spirulina sp. CS-785/01]|uniref:hypothetical protein n=1 Tax=Spirulina sp. CS-785/01 TaxID=3021716 RepID=UPI00232F8105|nr:hypothetical protein [Spirulina sp. CS-785/01]MDB9313718.1 hypothetical protein [Spirulina sp. CS-785/01]
MLLNEYSLTPDVFNFNSYGNSTTDEDCRKDICEIHLKQLLSILQEEALLRNLHGGKWYEFINRLQYKHPITTKKFLKALKKQRRLVTTEKVNLKKPSDDFEWCQEALSSHKQAPLTGIITPKATKQRFENNQIVASIEKLNETNWWLDRSPSVRLSRTVQDYVNNLKLIFQHSNSLMFIDPYLNPDSKSHNKFHEIFIKIPLTNSLQSIEFHVSLDRYSSEEYRVSFNHLKQQIKNLKIPITVFMWEQFHDRYLITDLVGISLPHGFGFSYSPKPKTTWTRLGKKHKDEVQGEFDPSTKQHRLIDTFSLP